MNTLDEDIGLENFSIYDYISSHLQAAFLPWPLMAMAKKYSSFITRLGDIDWTNRHRISPSKNLL